MMWFMDITVTKQGTDVEAVEALLLETFERYEKTEATVVEKSLHARVGSRYNVYRYRVYTKPDSVGGDYLIGFYGRLLARTNSAVRVTRLEWVDQFSVDRPRAVD